MSAAALRAVARAKALVAPYLADAYVAWRATTTPDGEGGTTAIYTQIDDGPCLLSAGATRPAELAVAGRAEGRAPLTVKLPLAASVTAEDTLVVNGRALAVLGVLRGGVYGVLATAVCEERG